MRVAGRTLSREGLNVELRCFSPTCPPRGPRGWGCWAPRFRPVRHHDLVSLVSVTNSYCKFGVGGAHSPSFLGEDSYSLYTFGRRLSLGWTASSFLPPPFLLSSLWPVQYQNVASHSKADPPSCTSTQWSSSLHKTKAHPPDSSTHPEGVSRPIGRKSTLWLSTFARVPLRLPPSS